MTIWYIVTTHISVGLSVGVATHSFAWGAVAFCLSIALFLDACILVGVNPEDIPQKRKEHANAN